MLSVRPANASTTRRKSEAVLIEDAYRRIAEHYVPRPYPGAVTLVLPQDDAHARGEFIVNWKSVVRTLSAHTVPGNHLTCITSFVEQTAALISERLNEGDC